VVCANRPAIAESDYFFCLPIALAQVRLADSELFRRNASVDFQSV